VIVANGQRLAQRRVYKSIFPLTENPISEGGNWINGATTGVDWKDMQTTPGLVFGPVNFATSTYNDATAVLSGSWRGDQRVETVVKSLNQVNGTTDFEEIEHRLRTTITANSIKGYEVNWACMHNGLQYHQIGYWYGPIGVQGGCALGCAFDAVPNSINSAGNGMTAAQGFLGIYDGDTVGSQIVGNRITTWIVYGPNSPTPGVKQILEDFNDTGGTGGAAKFQTGAPGVGHWYHSTSGAVSDFGFTSLIVSEV
jgi:hypothetical protein